MTGLRAELAVESPTVCPVADLSTDLDEEVRDVRKTARDGRVVEEFRTAAEAPAVSAVESVFEYGTERVYRVERADETCLCEAVEAMDCPVSDVRASGGTLFLTLHLSDPAEFRAVVERLHDRGEDVSVRYLVRSAADGEARDAAVVDPGRLTDRQVEVLETAYSRGYFEYPRESNATEVSRALDIEPSTFAEHLAAAQSKLLAQVLDR